jgi:hypothetical protein
MCCPAIGSSVGASPLQLDRGARRASQSGLLVKQLSAYGLRIPAGHFPALDLSQRFPEGRPEMGAYSAGVDGCHC